MLKRIVRMGNDAARARMIKQCDRQLLDCFSECARKVLKGNAPLKKRQYASLQRRKKDLRTLASKRTSLRKRKSIVQRGGFLTSFLVPAVAALGSILASRCRRLDGKQRAQIIFGGRVRSCI